MIYFFVGLVVGVVLVCSFSQSEEVSCMYCEGHGSLPSPHGDGVEYCEICEGTGKL